MNSWKFNSQAGYRLLKIISTCLKISINDVYKTVKQIENTTITTNDGKKYEIILKEIKDE